MWQTGFQDSTGCERREKMHYVLYALAFYSLGAVTSFAVVEFARRRVERFMREEKKQKKEEYNFWG
jgi:cytochrome c biogenesis protein CcdA